MLEKVSDVQSWYVVFDSSTNKHWWDIFTNPRFRHVLLWREVDGGCICLNPLSHCTLVQFYRGDIDFFIKQELAQGCAAILHKVVSYGMLYKPQPLEVFSCVTVAKRVLGIRNRFVLTPEGLYRELIKSGARNIGG